MIEELSLPASGYRREYDDILESFGWSMTDKYICHAFTGHNNTEEILNDAAFYLQELFDSQYIYFNKNHLIHIINLNKSSFSVSEISRRLDIYLRNNAS